VITDLTEPLVSSDPDVELRKWSLLAALHDNLEIEEDKTILGVSECIYQWLKTGVAQEEI
jgi:hypothetical protein